MRFILLYIFSALVEKMFANIIFHPIRLLFCIIYYISCWCCKLHFTFEY